MWQAAPADCLRAGGRHHTWVATHRHKKKVQRREAIKWPVLRQARARSVPKEVRFLGPPSPFSALPGPGVGSGRFGPGRSLGRSTLGTVSWLRAWRSRAVVPSCREFHGVLRRRRQSARRRPCVAYAVSAPCIASFVLRPGLGPLARAGRETGPRRGLGPCLVRRAHSRRLAPPFLSVGRRCAPSAHRRGWRGRPGSPGPSCAGLAVGACLPSRRALMVRALAYG